MYTPIRVVKVFINIFLTKFIIRLLFKELYSFFLYRIIEPDRYVTAYLELEYKSPLS